MMSSTTVSLAIFAALAVIVSADVTCFYGTSTTTGGTVIGQVGNTLCPGQFCLKYYQKSYNNNNYQTNSYGCANGVCTSSGCHENSNGYGQCCCRGSYCNSGFDLSKTAVSSMVFTVASVVYMYF